MAAVNRQKTKGNGRPKQSREESNGQVEVETVRSKQQQQQQQQQPATRLLTWTEIEHWQKDNAYILSAYRRASYSFKESFASLFYTHNEFVNIHTHLWGGVLFAALPLYLYMSQVTPEPLSKLPHPSPWAKSDTIAFSCFFAGAVFCLLMSATFHTISDHSLPVAVFGNKLDYVGIVLLITGSFVPSIYYGFYCEPFYQRLYWTMISTLGVACAVTSTLPHFRTPAWRSFRAAMFVGMGLSAVFPVLHGLSLWGVQGMENRIGLRWLVLQGVLYITGAGLYAARIPEKLSPGTFDVWGSSHQIFHVLVVLAACSHLVGLLKAGEYARTHLQCSVDAAW